MLCTKYECINLWLCCHLLATRVPLPQPHIVSIWLGFILMSPLIGRCHCRSLESCCIFIYAVPGKEQWPMFVYVLFMEKNNGASWWIEYTSSWTHQRPVRTPVTFYYKKKSCEVWRAHTIRFLGINDFYFPYILIYVYFAKYISHICNSYYHHHHPVRNNNFPNVVIFPCGCLSDVFVPSYTVGCFIYCQISI